MIPEDPDEQEVKALLERLVYMPGEHLRQSNEMGFVVAHIYMPGHLEWFDDRPRSDFLFSDYVSHTAGSPVQR